MKACEGIFFLVAAPGLLALSSCNKREKSMESASVSALTQAQLEARYGWDLGLDAVDVSQYPPKQQANYKVFKAKCSACHTLARPINSPYVKRQDWQRYTHRMHLHTKLRPKTDISKKQMQAILDFLVYDSKVRKVNQRLEFEAKTKELDKLFEVVQKERIRLGIQEDEKKARQASSYTGDKPSP